MIEFDYNLDYKNLMFEKNDKRYRIGRGEQGVLLVRPYTDEICKHWRFKTPKEAYISASRILFLYNTYRDMKDFVGMDMARKFLEMGFTRATSDKAKSAKIFKDARSRVTTDPKYIQMRKEWRQRENANV